MTPTGSVAWEEYRYQQALYSYLSGDYLSSLKLSRELSDSNLKNRAILLLRLSNSKLSYTTGQYPSFTPPTGFDYMPQLLALMDTLFKMGRYEDCLILGNALDKSGVGKYFVGISLLRLDRLEESVTALDQVPADDKFYPYARITIAQIEVMKRRNLKVAEENLKVLLSHPSIKKEGLTEKVYLLLGQILYERGLFPEAINYFLKISVKSPFYREAIIGKIWSLIRISDYEKTIPLFKNIGLNPIYDAEELETKIILGYCYLKLGMTENALKHFEVLLNNYSDTDMRLEKLIHDNSERMRYISILINRESPSLSREERHYLPILRSGFGISALLEKYRVLSLFKKRLVRMGKNILSRETYLHNTKKGLKKMIGSLDGRIRRVKDRVSMVRMAVDENDKKNNVEIYLNKNSEFFSVLKDRMFDLVKKETKKEITKDAKNLTMLILYEWVGKGGMPACDRFTMSCFIINNLLLTDNVKDRPQEIYNSIKILELIARDVYSNRQDKDVELKKIFSAIEDTFKERAEEREEIVKELENIRKKLKKDITEIENGFKVILSDLDTQLQNKFSLIRYDLLYFKDNIISGWDMATKGMPKL